MKINFEEYKLKLEEVNTYIRLGMKEEATASMAALTAEKKSLSVGREVSLSAIPSQSNQSEESKESGSINLLQQDKLNSGATLNQRPRTLLLEEDASSSSTLSSFRFDRQRKTTNKDKNPPVPELPPVLAQGPESVVVDSGGSPGSTVVYSGSPLFSPIQANLPAPQPVNPPSSLTREWKLQRKKR
jgi:hypothetical protein